MQIPAKPFTSKSMRLVRHWRRCRWYGKHSHHRAFIDQVGLLNLDDDDDDRKACMMGRETALLEGSRKTIASYLPIRQYT